MARPRFPYNRPTGRPDCWPQILGLASAQASNSSAMAPVERGAVRAAGGATGRKGLLSGARGPMAQSWDRPGRRGCGAHIPPAIRPPAIGCMPWEEGHAPSLGDEARGNRARRDQPTTPIGQGA
ncbi:MAG: hypothetical protein ACJAVS_002393, partial [Paracoccaceae bacterium]